MGETLVGITAVFVLGTIVSPIVQRLHHLRSSTHTLMIGNVLDHLDSKLFEKISERPGVFYLQCVEIRRELKADVDFVLTNSRPSIQSITWAASFYGLCGWFAVKQILFPSAADIRRLARMSARFIRCSFGRSAEFKDGAEGSQS